MKKEELKQLFLDRKEIGINEIISRCVDASLGEDFDPLSNKFSERQFDEIEKYVRSISRALDDDEDIEDTDFDEFYNFL